MDLFSIAFLLESRVVLQIELSIYYVSYLASALCMLLWCYPSLDCCATILLLRTEMMVCYMFGKMMDESYLKIQWATLVLLFVPCGTFDKIGMELWSYHILGFWTHSFYGYFEVVATFCRTTIVHFTLSSWNGFHIIGRKKFLGRHIDLIFSHAFRIYIF